MSDYFSIPHIFSCELVKKHNCPKSTEGTPRNLTKLKIYWQILDWEKHPILILYEDPTVATQGFSQTFHNFLTRFNATMSFDGKLNTEQEFGCRYP